jgi:hypothetical protein
VNLSILIPNLSTLVTDPVDINVEPLDVDLDNFDIVSKTLKLGHQHLGSIEADISPMSRLASISHISRLSCDLSLLGFRLSLPGLQPFVPFSEKRELEGVS